MDSSAHTGGEGCSEQASMGCRQDGVQGGQRSELRVRRLGRGQGAGEDGVQARTGCSEAGEEPQQPSGIGKV